MFNVKIALALLALAAAPALADAGSYSAYAYSASRGYGYRSYSYYSVTYQTVRTHVAVYHPRHPGYVYYYNPHSRVYWGRYDVAAGTYQLLPADARKATLAEIPDSAFGEPGALPPAEPGGEGLLPPPVPAPAKCTK